MKKRIRRLLQLAARKTLRPKKAKPLGFNASKLRIGTRLRGEEIALMGGHGIYAQMHLAAAIVQEWIENGAAPIAHKNG